jgi:hypothetical protein
MIFKNATLLKIVQTVGIVSSLHTVSAKNIFNNGNGNGNGRGGDDIVTTGEVKCVPYQVEALMASDVLGAPDDDVGAPVDELSYKVCEMEPEYEGGISGMAYVINENEFPDGFFTAEDFEISETLLTMSAAVKKNGKYGRILAPAHGATLKKEKKEKKNKRKLRGSRQLSPTMGTSTLLVLYAIPLDASNDNRNAVQLQNDIFGIGTNPDPVNVRSQMLACSRGQLEYIPACGTPEQTCSHPLIANGVMEVPINNNVTGVASGTVVNWVTAEAQNLLGTDININSFTQIMIVAPDEVSWNGAAAWAYLPGRVSAFRDNYANRMGVQMHEFGHNIGLHHSGYGTASYADHSCIMGNPSYGDDGPQICWNAAKSWESGWYALDSSTVIPSTGGASYELVGVADWASNVYLSGHKVVLEIQDSSETQSFYVIYNRAKGPNAGVKFAKDEVTISTGQSRKVSWHQAGLGAPDTGLNDYPLFRKSNYNGGTQDLVVKVCGMTSGIEGNTPDLASVLIYLDDGLGGVLCPGEEPPSPTPNPTPNPTAGPPPPGTFMLACGSSAHWNGDCGGQTLAADTAERHEVRCCKDSVTNPGGGWYQYAGRGTICENVWGESEDSNGVCQHALHYGEALAMCADLGGRLCTSEELLAECTRGSGCSHDRDMIWSSTEVVPTPAPTTANPTTANPTTPNPTTANPTTSNPTTAQPTTSNPTTAQPTTANPTTAQPTTSNPTTAQPTPTTALGYYVAGGSSANVYAGVVEEADPSELHEVRCCSSTSLGNGWKQHTNCLAAGFDVWGESEINGVCNSAKTHAEAVEICNAVGARLCTKEELLADCPRGTGCQFDKELNWSSSPVLPCTSDASCDDGRLCTINTCGVNGKCTATPNPGCDTMSVVCGSSGSGACNNKPVLEADPNELHEVRCCSDTSLGNGWKQHTNCLTAGFDAWGESEINGVCNSAKTYTEAVNICGAVGARLCSKEELLADCPRGTGCNFDREYNWSSSAYTAPIGGEPLAIGGPAFTTSTGATAGFDMSTTTETFVTTESSE